MSTEKHQFWEAARIALRHAPLWLWRAFAVGILIVIYVNVVARGIANNFPEAAMKLSKSAGLAFLAHYEETRNVQVTQLFALLFFVVMYLAWEALLRLAFGDESLFQRFAKPDVAKKALVIIGVTVLAADIWFYVCGITNSSWRGTNLSVSALISTAGFVGANAGVVMISLFLSPQKPLKEGE